LRPCADLSGQSLRVSIFSVVRSGAFRLPHEVFQPLFFLLQAETGFLRGCSHSEHQGKCAA
jgi:hypothetical protein